MNRLRKITAFIVTLLMLTAAPVVALATDVSVTTDATEVKAGDTVTLTVIVKADHIGVASGSFTYDPALLTYDSSDGGASDGYINMVSAQKGGSSSLSAVIKFTAKAKGTAAVNVLIDSVLSYDEQALETGQGNVSITITGTDAPPQPSESGETVPAVDLSQTGVEAQNVTGTEAQMYVWRDISSQTLPSGYVDSQVNYAGEAVGAAAIPDSDDMTLLYLSEKAGENAGYYIYNAQENTLVPYITITSKSASFSIIWPDQSATPPEGFEQTTLEWNKQTLPAWKAADSGDAVYLVYVRNSKGETGFYLFNTDDESVQRYAMVPKPDGTVFAPGTAVPEPGATETAPNEQPVSGQNAQIDSGITIDRTLFIGLCGAAALIVVAAILFAVLYFRCARSKLRRVARMKQRMEADTKEQEEPEAPPIKEKPIPAAPPAIPKETQEPEALSMAEKEKAVPAAPIVKEKKVPAADQNEEEPKTRSRQEPKVSETRNRQESKVSDKRRRGVHVKTADISSYKKDKDK